MYLFAYVTTMTNNYCKTDVQV